MCNQTQTSTLVGVLHTRVLRGEPVFCTDNLSSHTQSCGFGWDQLTSWALQLDPTRALPEAPWQKPFQALTVPEKMWAGPCPPPSGSFEFSEVGPTPTPTPQTRVGPTPLDRILRKVQSAPVHFPGVTPCDAPMFKALSACFSSSAGKGQKLLWSEPKLNQGCCSLQRKSHKNVE